MYKQDELKKLHSKKNYKYIFSPLNPFKMKEIYEKGEEYFINIQSFDEDTIVKFNYALNNFENNYLKVINLKLKEMYLSNQIITEIETITPVIITIDGGPWKHDIHSIDLLMQKIYDNLEKKYRIFFDEEWELKKDINKYDLFEKITILSKKPISRKYKDISLIGYKIKINIGNSDIAQKLVKIAIVQGVGEKNSIIGSGFVKYKSVRR